MAICAGCERPTADNQDHDLCAVCMDKIMNTTISFIISRDMAPCIICDELRCLDNLVISEGDYVCKEGCSPLKQFQSNGESLCMKVLQHV